MVLWFGHYSDFSDISKLMANSGSERVEGTARIIQGIPYLIGFGVSAETNNSANEVGSAKTKFLSCGQF